MTLVRATHIAAIWAFAYGVYRWYYALGGTVGNLGTPVAHEQWIRINAIAGVLLFAAALLPFLLLRAWRDRLAQPFLLAIAWIIAVGCATHALIGIPQRIASLAGVLIIEYPFWESIDRRMADLQALVFVARIASVEMVDRECGGCDGDSDGGRAAECVRDDGEVGGGVMGLRIGVGLARQRVGLTPCPPLRDTERGDVMRGSAREELPDRSAISSRQACRAVNSFAGSG